ncbi:radical SAM protein [Thermodesulfobacteriota bacterium]
MHTPELPLIRPPSEWQSLLVRLTRGCKWNRCRFCGIYPHLGEPEFSVRTVDEVIQDIDVLLKLRPRAKNAFFGDADPLQIGVKPFIEIARYLRKVMDVERLTCYARASTLYKMEPQAIKDIAAAGLNRVHIGLESGNAAVLRYHRKGQSPDMIRQVASRLKEAGVEISFYVLLGLGGLNNWRDHILDTARIIKETRPEFIRLRRLWLYGSDTLFSGPECPLLKEIRADKFTPQTPEGTILELKLLLEQTGDLSSFLFCDHENNYIHVSGRLDQDRADMLAEINDFLSLPEAEREAHYLRVGSRI